jgi:hypothetical protein
METIDAGRCHRLGSEDLAGFGALLESWRQRSPALGIVVLLPEAERQRIPELQASCRERRVSLLGAVFPALVADGDFLVSGAWVLCFDRMPAHFLATNLSGAADTAAPRLVRAAGAGLAGRAATERPPVLFLVFDGMLANIATLLNGLYAELGTQVRYAGVNAGSETFQPMPCLFDDRQVVGEAALGLLLPAETRVVVQHGYPVSKSLMKATTTVGNRIDRIDHRPAFDVYREVIGAEYGVALDHGNFYDYAVHFPFGVVTAIDVLVRIPVAFNDDGSLVCVGEVPPNAMLRLLHAPAVDGSRCIETIAGHLNAGGRLSRNQALLTFYCAGRRMHFGGEAADELAQLKRMTGAGALCGALSLGEIDCIEDLGLPRFHNASLVCLA